MPGQEEISHFQVITNGTNRYERVLDALMPANIAIDGREVIDVVFFTLETSKNYIYVDVSNGSTDKKWYSLLIQNKYFQLAHIYKYDLAAYIDEHSAALIRYGNTRPVGKAKLEEYLSRSINQLDKKSEDSVITKELEKWISWFDQYKEGQFKTFYVHLTVIQNETDQIHQILEGIKSRVEDESQDESEDDIVFEINDALTKLKRYFYAISNLAKDEFTRQLSEDENIEPHISLFLGFLNLFNSQKDQLNSLTQKHLDYCYGELLGAQKNNPQPDKVYVSFTPANNVPLYTLSSGAQLDAGKDGNNQPIVFTTDEDLVVSDTVVSSLKTLFISHFSQFSRQSGQDNAGNGIGLEMFQNLVKKAPLIPMEALKIQIGPGGDQAGTQPAGGQVPFTDEDLGLVIASSVFYIEDGHATINLALNLNDDEVYKTYQDYLKPLPFSIYVTTASGWRSVDSYTFAPQDNRIILTLHYNAMASPIGSYDPKIHPGNYPIQKPAIRINLRRQKDVSPYIYLQNLVINRIDIDVSVKQHKKIKLQTNAGAVSPGGPFQAFGPNPQPGGYFALRNANIFNQNLSSFEIHLEWMGLPSKPGGFGTYYYPYNQPPYNAGLVDPAFKVDMKGLSGNNYVAISAKSAEFPLFAVDNAKLSEKSDMVVKDIIKGKNRGFDNDASLEAEKDQDFSMPGAVRLTFVKPDAGFGFNLFPSVLANAIAKNANKNIVQSIAALFSRAPKAQITDPKIPNENVAKAATLTLPNQPYIPVIKAVSLDYHLDYSIVFDPNKAPKGDEDLTLIHINPFGYKTIYPSQQTEPIYFLMPQFLSGNNLFTGFTNLHANEPVNLLFTLDENRLENDFQTPTPVGWFYLRGNEWIRISPNDIISDTTNGFTRNGIVKLTIPDDITTDNAVMPPGTAWILATISEDDPDNNMIRNLSTIIHSVTNNSVSATRQIAANSTSPGPFILASGSVKDLVTRVPQITTVAQTLPSYGGYGAESSESYYLRVSERLRHKSRPLSAWEVERIVLDNFPMIRYVKCINFKANAWHMPKINEQPDILVIVVGDVYYSETSSVKIGYTTLSEIKIFLATVINAKINIAVSNPHAERLKLKCDIKFKNNDWSKEMNLEADFANYLNPWLLNPDKKIKINTVIYTSDLLGFLRNLPYVDDIKNLVLIHIYEKSLVEETGIDPAPGSQAERDESTSYMLEEITDDRPLRTYLPYGVFVASAPHLLSPIGSPDQPKFMGIRDMTINDDFRVEGEMADKPSDTGINISISDEKLNFTIDI